MKHIRNYSCNRLLDIVVLYRLLLVSLFFIKALRDKLEIKVNTSRVQNLELIIHRLQLIKSPSWLLMRSMSDLLKVKNYASPITVFSIEMPAHCERYLLFVKDKELTIWRNRNLKSVCCKHPAKIFSARELLNIRAVIPENISHSLIAIENLLELEMSTKIRSSIGVTA